MSLGKVLVSDCDRIFHPTIFHLLGLRAQPGPSGNALLDALRRERTRDAERRSDRSHAERGNENPSFSERDDAQRHDDVRDKQNHQGNRRRNVQDQPPVQPAVQPQLRIELPPLVTQVF